jgi:hypothetical protein
MNAAAMMHRSLPVAATPSPVRVGPTVCRKRPEDGESLAAMALGFLAVVPWAIVVVEVIVGLILMLLSLMFAATIYLIFVALLLWYAGLWLAVVLNGIGVAAASVASVAPAMMLRSSDRLAPGRVVGWISLGFSLGGLAINAALLGLAVYGLTRAHGLVS